MKFRYSLAFSLLALSTAGSINLLHSSPAFAAETTANAGYFRSPSIENNQLVFTAEGDLWTQTLGQPQARRLTSLPAEEIGAVISNDGKQVAYVANYEGASEVYVIPITGGIAKRVSFENSRVRVQGWTHDGKILYSTDNAVGPSNYWVLRTVSPDTLETQDLPLADANQGVIDAKGEYVYFTRFGLQTTGDNLKVYRGGAKGQLWRYKLGSDQEAQWLTKGHEGSASKPMLWQDRLYFISDSDGNSNIWSMSLNGQDVKQESHFKDWSVRGARMDDGKIVFQQGADIKLFDIKTAATTTVDIKLTTDLPHKREHWVTNPMEYATSTKLAPQGDKVVITARGHVAIAGVDGQRLVELTLPGHSRVRGAILSQDGKWVYGISDASGEQEIWRYAADGSDNAKQLTHNGKSMRMSLNLSPDGRYLAHDDYDGNVWLLDLKKDNDKKIVTHGEGLGPYADIKWSPDSRYIALTKAEIGHSRPQIVLYSLNHHRAESLTTDKYESFSPSFSPDGQWLYFLSNRQFTSTPSSPWGDRNLGPVFDKRTQIFAFALDKEARFPFQAPNELMHEEKAADENDAVKVKVDWEGLSSRLWQVPVASGNYSSLAVTKAGLYVLDRSITPGSAPALKVIKLSAIAPKVDTFAEGIASFAFSKDQQKMFIRKQANNGAEMLIVPTADKLPADVAHSKVQTQLWQLAIDPAQEWQQLFEDAWLMHRDSFFDKKMRGLDWQAVKAKYQPLVDRLTDRNELNDIFMQMMGELDSLHSQVRGGDIAKNPHQAHSAMLGARLAQTQKGVEITHIYQNDPELPAQASPLSRMGVDAKVGDVIVAINGKPLTNISDVTRLLRNQANKQVLLELKRGRKSTIKTVITPVTTRANNQLRYLDWVNNNEQKVSGSSDNKIGYLHLYAMGSGDIASFAREFYANINKQGLIIDVRRNRGGNIDSWIIEKLLRRTWAFWQPTHGTPNGNMQQTFNGHLVVLTDQLTYSDGETFSAGVKSLGIAPLIGKTTAGAGVWLSGRNSLADKGMARVAEYPQYSMDGRWIVEGIGVSPDIEVNNLPLATFKGHDAQLEKAISYLKNEMQQKPVPTYKAEPLPKNGMAKQVLPLPKR